MDEIPEKKCDRVYQYFHFLPRLSIVNRHRMRSVFRSRATFHHWTWTLNSHSYTYSLSPLFFCNQSVTHCTVVIHTFFHSKSFFLIFSLRISVMHHNLVVIWCVVDAFYFLIYSTRKLTKSKEKEPIYFENLASWNVGTCQIKPSIKRF